MGRIFNYVIRIYNATLTLTRPLSNLIFDVFCWIIYGATKPLPPIDNRILLMSATELAEKIRKKELSAVEVMQAYIKRIKAVQPVVNACVDSRFKEAMADARAVDMVLNSKAKSVHELTVEMPLLGVPFTCKEIIGVKHLAQTCGLLSQKDNKAPEDSDAAAQYRKAGAIPVVVTNIPTRALWWDTENFVFGRTKNPYNNNRAPGGSSGGEAALITSAGAVIGIGNDLGGSIRIPSSFCGIYGHKPSRGIISNKSPSGVAAGSIEHFWSTGPMCRYAEDLLLLTKVLCGNDLHRERLNEMIKFRYLNVYYMEEFPGIALSPTSDVKAAVKKAVRHFEEEYKITPGKLEMQEMKYAFDIWLCKIFEAAGPFLRETLTHEGGKFNVVWEYVKSIFGYSNYDYRILYFIAIELRKKDEFYEKCLAMYESMETKLEEILYGKAILILPVHPEPPPHSILTIPKLKNIAYTCIFNILGLPVTVVPAGLSKGLPIGLQIAAAKGNDYLTLTAAVELNKVFGGWKSPCPITT